MLKKILFISFCVINFSFIKWQPDFETAQKYARENHKLILLNFSGSDWCGPCIRLRKEIFESEVFSKMSDTALAMVNADFPRNKKNQLDMALTKKNESLADKYNPAGKFPFTLLLDSNGKVISSWDGLPAESAEEFTNEVKRACDANK
jgi:thioredoxin-related protein